MAAATDLPPICLRCTRTFNSNTALDFHIKAFKATSVMCPSCQLHICDDLALARHFETTKCTRRSIYERNLNILSRSGGQSSTKTATPSATPFAVVQKPHEVKQLSAQLEVSKRAAGERVAVTYTREIGTQTDPSQSGIDVVKIKKAATVSIGSQTKPIPRCSSSECPPGMLLQTVEYKPKPVPQKEQSAPVPQTQTPVPPSGSASVSTAAASLQAACDTIQAALSSIGQQHARPPSIAALSAVSRSPAASAAPATMVLARTNKAHAPPDSVHKIPGDAQAWSALKPQRSSCPACGDCFSAYSTMLGHIELRRCVDGLDRYTLHRFARRDENMNKFIDPDGWYRCPGCRSSFTYLGALYDHVETRKCQGGCHASLAGLKESLAMRVQSYVSSL